MRKFYVTLCLAMMAMTSFAQEQNDTTYVMMDFTQNPWNYPIREVTKGWAPDYTDWDTPGAILDNTDFSWPISEGSSEKIKVTLYAVDLDEYSKVSVYANYELNDAETASLGINAGKTSMLYTQPGTTMRFEAPAGYQFGKMVFYNFRNANFLVGDEYEEEYPYEYNGSTFLNKLKVWTPASPKIKEYPEQDLSYNMWEGDAKNILLNYPYFSAVFVKIDIRLVSDGTDNITTLKTDDSCNSQLYTLDGRSVTKTENLSKGLYIANGKKYVVK
ncbi:MAG: hypothetical protein J6T44_00665 [Prevotella sp.]|nr:hypothetical protein [Prevotella sp.]MBO7537773.1 hypothetical protein [Prevotella sp.]